VSCRLSFPVRCKRGIRIGFIGFFGFIGLLGFVGFIGLLGFVGFIGLLGFVAPVK
jgi:hypothetical protein